MGGGPCRGQMEGCKGGGRMQGAPGGAYAGVHGGTEWTGAGGGQGAPGGAHAEVPGGGQMAGGMVGGGGGGTEGMHGRGAGVTCREGMLGVQADMQGRGYHEKPHRQDHGRDA